MRIPVSSVTHAHLVHALAAELRHRPSSLAAQVLDAGCGNGQLMLACHRYLPILTSRQVRIFGFDVDDVRVQRSDFFAETVRTLESKAPDVPWAAERLFQTSASLPWPFPAETFDAIVSNQVLEHVVDIDFFLRELERVLKPGGICINLFPVRSLMIEGHVGVPFAHRIGSDDVRRAYITRFGQVGLSRLGPMRMAGTLSPTEFGRSRSEYVATQTAYRSFRELSAAAHRNGLTASYRWTPHFFVTKLGYMTGRDTSRLYRRYPLTLVVECLTFRILSLISSVTVVFEKNRAYDPDGPDAGHLP